VQGPVPFADKSDVVVQFFAFGDSPYDAKCEKCNTCIALDDVTQEADCTRFDCLDYTTLEDDNTCTYEGREYECWRDTIIPYMNSRIDAGDAAFSVHAGDFIKGVSALQTSPRCNPYALASRRNLFSAIPNFLIVPGDNDWNECADYNLNSNTDPHQKNWRRNFAEAPPFQQFSTNFPGGDKPIISRKDGNPEIFHFEYDKVAFFGLNMVSGKNYVNNISPVDLNEEWLEYTLSNSSCELESIVLFAHKFPKENLYNKLTAYFDRCEKILPTVTITGNTHPESYCMTKTNERVDVTVEAYRSSPLLVSIVRDQGGVYGDFVHVEDPDPTVSSFKMCPRFDER